VNRRRDFERGWPNEPWGEEDPWRQAYRRAERRWSVEPRRSIDAERERWLNQNMERERWLRARQREYDPYGTRYGRQEYERRREWRRDDPGEYGHRWYAASPDFDTPGLQGAGRESYGAGWGDPYPHDPWYRSELAWYEPGYRSTGWGERELRPQSLYDQGTGRYTGRGPKGYRRSDERIREEINDRLTENSEIDAADIDVDVKDCEVTLRGTVEKRHQKWMAESVAETVTAVCSTGRWRAISMCRSRRCARRVATRSS
jgi:hypothetical protein